MLRALICIAILTFGSGLLLAQQPADYAAERGRAIALINEKKYAEALPLFEKLAASPKADGQVFLGLGMSYWHLQDPKDLLKSKPVRAKARAAFITAKELGISNPDIDMLVTSIKPDGGEAGVSDNPAAQLSMEAANSFFASGDRKNAAVAYAKAAALDPTLYEAALYTGNSYYGMKDYDNAGIWFAKAITIDPDRETAYRYWADGLAKDGKEKEAIEKYLEAIIAEPYSGLSWRGLTQFAKAKNISLSHPTITVPVGFESGGDGKTTISLGSLLGAKDGDGSAAWLVYGMARAGWQTDKEGKLSKTFAEAYPRETRYRHSLAEEASAFRMVLSVAKEVKDKKKPEKSIAALQKLEAAGLLESYILFARSTPGIARDYPAYRSANRVHLKRYLTDIVMKNGGK